MTTDPSIGAVTKLRNSALRLYFASGKVKLASAAVKEQYVRWQLKRLLREPSSVSRPGVPVRDDIVVSLTSWEKRLHVLPLALYCLVHQSVWPARLEVWLTEEDLARLDDEVRVLFSTYGVEFRTCEDYRSHKKWLPAVREHEKRYVITADDDVLYPHHWLRWLLRDFDPRGKFSVAHVCHEVTFDESGNINHYGDFNRKVEKRGRVSYAFIGVGYGGQVLHRDWIPEPFLNVNRIMKVSPRSDDVWLACALKSAGIPTRQSRVYVPLLEVGGTYENSLQQYNSKMGMKPVQFEETIDTFDLTPCIFRSRSGQ